MVDVGVGENQRANAFDRETEIRIVAVLVGIFALKLATSISRLAVSSSQIWQQEPLTPSMAPLIGICASSGDWTFPHRAVERIQAPVMRPTRGKVGMANRQG